MIISENQRCWTVEDLGVDPYIYSRPPFAHSSTEAEQRSGLIAGRAKDGHGQQTSMYHTGPQ